ncbi:MAG TPA: class I SAM-dependent methyltransferase [Ktedonobacteraceae bacterium]|nr:class I SAM-dependent methyltransferase [Ktedonobacteraceae bacterium]
MSTPTHPQQEHPSTYIVQDRSNKEELSRLQVHDRMFTSRMGGVLPEQPDPTLFQRVLDVGCGTGGWLIECAKTYSHMSLLIGVDASHLMIDYAHEQAQIQGVSDRVEFHVMDALRMLEFPTGFFDLVNQRAGMSWLRTWDWNKLLTEYRRVAKPGGVIRVTEGDLIPENNSPALTRIGELGVEATYQAGHLFTAEPGGLRKELAALLKRHSIQQIQTREYVLEYRAGTDEWRDLFEDLGYGIRTGLPFLQKWTRVPDNYEEICQQALTEMQQPDFVATWHVLTAWGTAP